MIDDEPQRRSVDLAGGIQIPTMALDRQHILQRLSTEHVAAKLLGRLSNRIPEAFGMLARMRQQGGAGDGRNTPVPIPQAIVREQKRQNERWRDQYARRGQRVMSPPPNEVGQNRQRSKLHGRPDDNRKTARGGSHVLADDRSRPDTHEPDRNNQQGAREDFAHHRRLVRHDPDRIPTDRDERPDDAGERASVPQEHREKRNAGCGDGEDVLGSLHGSDVLVGLQMFEMVFTDVGAWHEDAPRRDQRSFRCGRVPARREHQIEEQRVPGRSRRLIVPRQLRSVVPRTRRRPLAAPFACNIQVPIRIGRKIRLMRQVPGKPRRSRKHQDEQERQRM
ncbi:MAG: hypothetical protein DMF92_02795 [Acidobacteria bacterium]|nr:MAG: hypothetical protein DMF92_02795 [Acidobacteriota bacterium]